MEKSFSIISTRTEHGRRIVDFLRAELHLPDYTTAFTVEFLQSGEIRVKCEYMPTVKGLER